MTNQPARGMHTGQIWHENDWLLHVGNVDITGDQVAFTVDEFPGTLMHRSGATVLDLDEPVSPLTGRTQTPARFWDEPDRDDWTVRIGDTRYDVNDLPDAGDLL